MERIGTEENYVCSRLPHCLLFISIILYLFCCVFVFFGTGSLIYQTLPLAIYFFLKYPSNFEKAVLGAVNSYRSDTYKEKKKLAGLSWNKQLQEAKGGNTDGIAGLTGAFAGAYLGINKIPRKFLTVEDKQKLKVLAEELINENG